MSDVVREDQDGWSEPSITGCTGNPNIPFKLSPGAGPGAGPVRFGPGGPRGESPGSPPDAESAVVLVPVPAGVLVSANEVRLVTFINHSRLIVRNRNSLMVKKVVSIAISLPSKL